MDIWLAHSVNNKKITAFYENRKLFVNKEKWRIIMKNKQIIGVLALTAALTFTSLVHPYRISAAEGDTKEVAAEEALKAI